MSVLSVSGLVSGYRLGTVLHGIDLEVGRGDAVAVLGRNGVGKTTLIHSLMGMVRPRAGSVQVEGRELAGRRTDAIARAGVALVPQGRRVFGPLTVDEHLDLCAAFGRRKGQWTRERVLELFPRLGERLGHAAAQLSGGEQQMVAIARALLANPVLLLLDEPSEGLAPGVVRQIGEVLARVREEGVGIVIVEQDLHLAFTVAGEVCVMDKGRVVHRASVPAFRRDPVTARRLLGIG
ncbi:MAG: Branched-chain amino acid transport ATP-binding protein LivF [uncultured Solirubrobacteraceae bacterium]|uniref:Branched-chain amino acid transport ATP-binding protein LivF n=1 Tax=uncultured Solirubrobacteraceae bacterium TaxID=1162706 RepID=A0A6J4TNX7_9ACTN|nr:MAG: Branched-chain amino acid transport ATP-binding protein LivF [uncultured Solirubrobacteraceae bacterium]